MNSRNVESEIKQFVAEKHVDAQLAQQLRDFAEQAPEVCKLLLVELSPSANALRGFIELSREIGRRDDLPAFQILESPKVLEIVAHDGWSRKEKQKRVREHLEKLRYPWRAQREQAIGNLVSKLKSDYGIRIETPQDLEGDSLMLNLSVKSPEEFREVSQQLDKLARSPDLAELFRLLVGR